MNVAAHIYGIGHSIIPPARAPHNGTAPSIDASRSIAHKVADDRAAILRTLNEVYPECAHPIIHPTLHFG